MSGILIKITSTDYAADRFRWYEVFGHTSDIPDDNDVEGTASFAVISRDNYIPHVGLTPGDSWYHWVRGVYDDGSIKSDYLKFGPDTAPGNGSITASQITDASSDAVDLITAADFDAMKALLGLSTVALTNWTPTDASGAGLTLTVGSAKYIQIGKFVLAFFNLTWPSTANASVNSIGMGGLPTPASIVVGVVGFNNVPGNYTLYANSGASAVDLYKDGGTRSTNAALSTSNLRGMFAFAAT